MMKIRPFDSDSTSAGEWTSVHVFRRARAAEDDLSEPVLDDAEFERQARHRWPVFESRRWYAWVGGEIAGGGGVSFRREGTVDHELHAPYVFAWGGVRGPWRRRGVGATLLRPMLDAMRERGSRVATFETSKPSGGGFLLGLGAVPKHRQIENRASFAGFDWNMLARWRAAASACEGLRWEVHERRVPRNRIEPLIPQLDALTADVPNGELGEPPTHHELESWLASYEEQDRSGGEHLMVLLMEGERVAAVYQASWNPRTPDRIQQHLTAVAPSWRGYGLAKGVKAALLLLVRERHPEVHLAVTSNAVVNTPMLSLNARLGFAEHRRLTSYQIGVDALETAVTGASEWRRPTADPSP